MFLCLLHALLLYTLFNSTYLGEQYDSFWAVEVCWGNDDAALLRFLDRALPCESALLWTTEDYGPAPEAS